MSLEGQTRGQTRGGHSGGPRMSTERPNRASAVGTYSTWARGQPGRTSGPLALRRRYLGLGLGRFAGSTIMRQGTYQGGGHRVPGCHVCQLQQYAAVAYMQRSTRDLTPSSRLVLTHNPAPSLLEQHRHHSPAPVTLVPYDRLRQAGTNSQQQYPSPACLCLQMPSPAMA